jgi:hypothetical protein
MELRVAHTFREKIHRNTRTSCLESYERDLLIFGKVVIPDLGEELYAHQCYECQIF